MKLSNAFTAPFAILTLICSAPKRGFYYVCRESGATCLPSETNLVYSGGNGAPENSILCGDKTTLPNWLPAGDYVLQWTWMSAGSSYGNIASNQAIVPRMIHY